MGAGLVCTTALPGDLVTQRLAEKACSLGQLRDRYEFAIASIRGIGAL